MVRFVANWNSFSNSGNSPFLVQSHTVGSTRTRRKVARACESTGACLARWNPAQGCPAAESLVSFVGEDGREELCTCTVKPKRVYTKALSASRSVRSKRTHHQTSWENVFKSFLLAKKRFLVFPFAECVSQCLKTLKFRILAKFQKLFQFETNMTRCFLHVKKMVS